MAESKPAKKRSVKKSETVRERTEKVPTNKSKRRVIIKAASKAGAPIRALKPLTRPFRTKPVKKTAYFIGLVLWPKYFRGAWSELRQVVWPSRKETWKLTSAVFVFAIVFGAVIAISDFGLDKLFKKIILK